jgi:hypothetical protein
MCRVNAPLITNDMIYRDGVHVRLRHDLNRAAAAVWWGVYTVEDALQEIRGQAFLAAERMKIDPGLIDAAAVEWLDEELSRHEDEHSTSLQAMTDAALVVLRQSGTRVQVRRAVAVCAADRPLLPPPHIMNAAVEAAAQQQRRAEFWWKKRESAE